MSIIETDRDSYGDNNIIQYVLVLKMNISVSYY